jgi:hypothetical protein
MRQKYLQITKDFPSQIKDLEEEFAPNRVWKYLNLGPTQQEVLINKLLDASYLLDQVETVSGVKSQKQFIPGGGPKKSQYPLAPDGRILKSPSYPMTR